ncbi:MAG: cation diffusion facilitator family transporter [Candidatus Bathyarchaeota archaeon]|nr:cation diffusion facilitator family transporter [Candidatus Bathyarchaeota archaeon]
MNKKSTAASAILGGVLIFAVKLYAWWISGSVALLSDALESVVNIIASVMMFASVLISEKPPDEDHMYGHQKIENISCFIEGFLVMVAGLLIAWAAYGRLMNPVELVELNIAVFISLFATSLNGVLSWLLMRTADKTGSLALEGDAKHLLSDVISSVGVIIGLFIGEQLGIPVIDPLMAMIVAALVLRMGVGLVLKSGGGLMDESCADSETEIKRIMDMHHQSFVDYHNLKTRKSGEKVFAELHLSLDGGLSVQEAHEFTDHLEDDVRNELPNVSLTIHIEPEKNNRD